MTEEKEILYALDRISGQLQGLAVLTRISIPITELHKSPDGWKQLVEEAGPKPGSRDGWKKGYSDVVDLIAKS